MRPATPLRIESPRIAVLRNGLRSKVGWASFAGAVGPWLLAATVSGLSDASRGYLTLLGVASAFAGFVAAAALRRGAPKEGTLTIAKDAIIVTRRGRERVVPNERIQGGFVVPSEGGTFAEVEIEVEDGETIRAMVDDEEMADEVLAAAELDASRRRVLLQLSPRVSVFGRFLGGLAAALYGSILPLTMFAATPFLGEFDLGEKIMSYAMFMLLSMSVFMAASTPDKLSIGADGLSVRGSLRTRFIPYSELEEIELTPAGLKLAFHDDRSQLIYWGGLPEDQRRAVARRAQEALAHAKTTPQQASLELLERKGRPLSSWRTSIKRILAGAGGFRAIPVDQTMIEQALQDTGAAPERRIGAALALAELDPPRAAARIRIAAEACANEPMRVALEKAAAGELDDEAYEAAAAEPKKRHIAAS